MPISASSFLYPWDLGDIGTAEALRRFRDDGFDAFDLTALYHPITTFVPGAPGRRLMQTDDGGVFFPARTRKYGRIKPRLYADEAVLRAWHEAAEQSAALGLAMSAWVVGMFQPWIALDHPDCARVLPGGQRVTAGVCPTNPDVQDFLATAVADLVEQFPLSAVQLEGITAPFFDTGWRAGAGTRLLVQLGPWGRRLQSLCFCPSCTGAAEAAGVAVEPLRARILAELAQIHESGDPGRSDADAAHAEWLAGDADYAAYVALRDDAAARLFHRLADAVAAAPRKVRLGIWGPAEFDGTMLPLERVIDRVDILQFRQPLAGRANAEAARRLRDERPSLMLKAVHWCGGAIGPPFGPELEAALAASAALGVDRIHLMNWALLSPAIARRIVPLLRDVEATTRPAG